MTPAETMIKMQMSIIAYGALFMMTGLVGLAMLQKG